MNWYGAVLLDASRVVMAVLLLLLLGVSSGCSQPDGSTVGHHSVAKGAENSLTSEPGVPGAHATVTDDAMASVSPEDVDEVSELPADRPGADGQLGRAMLVQAVGVEGDAAESGRGNRYGAAAGTSSVGLAPNVPAAPAAIDVSGEMAALESAEAGLADAATGPGPGQTAPHATAAKQSSDRGAKQPPREPLFVGWPKPRVALVVTGSQYGFLEPCGCSGLDNQNGGLVRRSSLIKQLTDKGWPVIPIDAGNQVRRFGRQAEIKFDVTIRGLMAMGYRAIALGPDDLRLPATELCGTIVNAGIDPNPFVAANLVVMNADFTSAYLVLEQGGKKIGITAVLGERNQKLVNNDDVTMGPAEEGIRQVWPKLQQARCDLYVLIAHATTEESIALGQKFPQFKVVITTGGAGEPTIQPEIIEGTDCQLVDVGTKGMYAGVVAMFDDPATPLRYQRIPLDARFPDCEELLQLLATYQDQIKDAGFEGLGLKPLPLPGGGKFIGSKACEDCHEDEYKIWKDGIGEHAARHSHAYATLQNPPKRSKIPRNHDPECLSCHVVGWNPQKYFPYVSGFLSLEETPELINVGCENCHGPGAQHTAAENGDIEVEEDEMQLLRTQQILALEDAEKKCLECHDLDNSPAFQEEGAFQRYWEKIKHGSEKKKKKDKKDKKK